MSDSLLLVAAVGWVIPTVLVFLILRRRTDSVDHTGDLRSLAEQTERVEKGLRDELARGREETHRHSKDLREELTGTLLKLTQSIELKLRSIEESNANKLEDMRRTVDEKLQGTLEKRLGDSFKLVSERLELVHKGLGEMQNLASGVGDLKRVLTNVKTRGTWGEFQLQAILEQVLLPSQFEKNVHVRPDSADHVEFAVRLPGAGGEDKPVWLPIDSKFPKEDYERILDAQDRADADALKSARDSLAKSLRVFAKDIRDQYIAPPWSTDFAILFVPTEGLFAEICQYPGLLDMLQREYRVSVAGPTTLSTLLNSLQMGFQTLAIQKRSSEVWELLGHVKKEFGKYAELLSAVEKKLDEAKSKISSVRSKTTTITRHLKKVDELPSATDSILDWSAPTDDAEVETEGEVRS